AFTSTGSVVMSDAVSPRRPTPSLTWRYAVPRHRRVVHRDSTYRRQAVKNQWRMAFVQGYAAAICASASGVRAGSQARSALMDRVRESVAMRLFAVIACCVVPVVTLAACSTPRRGEPTAPPGPPSDATANLADYHTGVSSDDREPFYHLSEGSEMIPLALLQALERPHTPQDSPGEGLLPFMDNLARYG